MQFPEVVDQPFGPYLDEELLVESKLIKNRKNKVFTLKSVVFEQGGQHVGLDHTSDISARDRAPIRFRGILILEDIRWLTDEGKALLKKELTRRGQHTTDVFSKHKSRVLIQGTLHLHPAYLTQSKGLQIYSIDRTGLHVRQYDVISLNVYTYSHSRLFLSRYRTLDALKSIFKRNPSTPIEERTPIWLVDRYFEDIQQRNDEMRQNDPTFLPRHIHRSDIFNVFGQHSDWLGELVIKQKLLNKVAWMNFCSEAKNRTQRRFWDADKITIGSSRRWKHKASTARVDSESDMDDVEFDETSGWARATYTYHVEGFCPPRSSSPDAAPKPSTDSDSESFYNEPLVPSLAAMTRIHPQIIMTPVIPQDYMWNCPIRSCEYDINLLDLSKENLAGLKAKDQKWLQAKSWTLDDQRFCELFSDMAESHYFNHLRENGIKVLGRGTDEVDRYGRRVFGRRKIDKPRQLRTDDNAVFEATTRWNGIN